MTSLIEVDDQHRVIVQLCEHVAPPIKRSLALREWVHREPDRLVVPEAELQSTAHALTSLATECEGLAARELAELGDQLGTAAGVLRATQGAREQRRVAELREERMQEHLRSVPGFVRARYVFAALTSMLEGLDQEQAARLLGYCVGSLEARFQRDVEQFSDQSRRVSCLAAFHSGADLAREDVRACAPSAQQTPPGHPF